MRRRLSFALALFLPLGSGHALTLTEDWACADADSLTCRQAWTEMGSDVDIVSQRAQVQNGAGGDTRARVETDFGSTDQTCKVDVVTLAQGTSVANWAGVTARHSNSANTFYATVVYQWGTDLLKTYKMVAGVFTELASTTITSSFPDEIKLRVSGTTVAGFQNGVPIHSVSDTAITTGLRCGLYLSFGSTATKPEVDNWAGTDNPSGEFGISGNLLLLGVGQ